MNSLFLIVAVLAQIAGPPPTVSQMDRAFDPENMTVSVGETLRIENDDRFTHHVLAEGPGLNVDSGAQRPGEWLEIEFRRQGIYNISCDIHPKMKLTVEAQ